jgi:serine/threonine protein kinase
MPPLSLYTELKDATTTCPLTFQKHIQPDRVREIVTAERIKAELPSTWGRRLWPFWDWFLEYKVKQATKVIAILVLLGKHESIDALLADGLTDDHLPLVEDGNNILSHCRRKTFSSFKTCPGHGALIEMFLEAQWVVSAPMLDFESGNVRDIRLHPQCALPFDCNLIGHTGYNTVYKGLLWPSYHLGFEDKVSLIWLSCFGRANIDGIKIDGGQQSQVCVAIKQFKDDPKDPETRKNVYFYEEVANLKLTEKINNDHLVKHLATCEQARCIFFPWADGYDLRVFWGRHSQGELERTPNVFLWAIRQITGLAHALTEIHEMKIRHGDLKPSNILHFTSGNAKLGTLKIADFGVSRKHEIDTGFRTKPTITKASTFTYQAAEAEKPYKDLLPRSRRYDSWSMGCIMLEFVIWLLFDCTAVASCESLRDYPDYAYYRPIFDTSDRREKPIEDAMEIHPVVAKAIEGLAGHPRFKGTALEAIVNLVESYLLKIQPDKRLSAAGMHEKLQGILDDAHKDIPSFAKAVDPTLVPPDVFSQPLSPDNLLATYERH